MSYLETHKSRVSGKLLSIQAMRAFAALSVVVYHLLIKMTEFGGVESNLFQVGAAGVDLFFIISGFIMFYVTGSVDLKFGAFIRDRIVRIIPLYWALSLVALCVFLVYPRYVNSSGGGTDVLRSFFLIPGDKRFLIQNGWTLSYEFMFYAVLGSLLVFRESLRMIFASVIFLILSLVGFVFKPASPLLQFLTSQLHLEFVLGLLVYLAFRSSWIDGRSAVVIPFSIIFLVIVNHFGSMHEYVVGHRLFLLGVPAAILCVGLLGLEGFFRRFGDSLSVRLLVHMGECSFSLYLVHPFALSLAAIVCRKLGLFQYGALASLLMLSSAVLGGLMCYRYLEGPLMTVARAVINSPSRKIAVIVEPDLAAPFTTASPSDS